MFQVDRGRRVYANWDLVEASRRRPSRCLLAHIQCIVNKAYNFYRSLDNVRMLSSRMLCLVHLFQRAFAAFTRNDGILGCTELNDKRRQAPLLTTKEDLERIKVDSSSRVYQCSLANFRRQNARICWKQCPLKMPPDDSNEGCPRACRSARRGPILSLERVTIRLQPLPLK
jgi:hypothetical protein